MDLLVTSQLLIGFATNYSKYPKNTFEDSLHSLFTNKNNRFLISRRIVDHLENLVVGNQIAQTFLETFLAEIINNQSLNVPGGKHNAELDILSEMNNNYIALPGSNRRDVYFNLSENDALSLNNQFSIVYSKANFPNIHYIGWFLSSYNPNTISIRYYDVTTNQEIQDLFNFALSVSSSSEIDLFDRYSNIGHSLFDEIKSKPLNYHTSYKNGTEETTEIIILKANFPHIRIYKTRKYHTHERKIIIGNLVIEVDEDFGNIKIGKTTWKIDITYCSSISQKLRNKKSIVRYILVR